MGKLMGLYLDVTSLKLTINTLDVYNEDYVKYSQNHKYSNMAGMFLVLIFFVALKPSCSAALLHYDHQGAPKSTNVNDGNLFN